MNWDARYERWELWAGAVARFVAQWGEPTQGTLGRGLIYLRAQEAAAFAALMV